MGFFKYIQFKAKNVATGDIVATALSNKMNFRYKDQEQALARAKSDLKVGDLIIYTANDAMVGKKEYELEVTEIIKEKVMAW